MNDGACYNLEHPERSETINLPNDCPAGTVEIIPDTTGEYLVRMVGDQAIAPLRPVAFWGGETYRGRFARIEGPVGATVFCMMRK